MERRALIRSMIRSVQALVGARTVAEFVDRLADRGVRTSPQAVTSWLTDAEWQRIPEPFVLGALLNIAGITDPGERLRYFDPTPTEAAAS